MCGNSSVLVRLYVMVLYRNLEVHQRPVLPAQQIGFSVPFESLANNYLAPSFLSVKV